MADEITNEQVAAAASDPASISVDGVTVNNRSVSELLDAQERLANQKNATSKRRGLLFSKIIPGSAVGGPGRRR